VLPSNLSAKFGVGFYISISIAFVVSSAMGLMWHSEDEYEEDTMTKYWQVMLVWPAAITVLRLVLYFGWFNYETPQFYLEKFGHQSSKARIRQTLRYKPFLTTNPKNSIVISMLRNRSPRLKTTWSMCIIRT
jgi:hypothetical protein